MARQTFRGHIPDGLLYDVEYDMWVRTTGGEVFVGATSFGIHLAGEIIAFTAKPRGANVERGRGLGTIECAKTVLAVHAPLSFTLLVGNDGLEEHPIQINRAPYDVWMARGMPTDWDNDLARLVDAAAYRAHVLRLEPAAQFT